MIPDSVRSHSDVQHQESAGVLLTKRRLAAAQRYLGNKTLKHNVEYIYVACCLYFRYVFIYMRIVLIDTVAS